MDAHPRQGEPNRPLRAVRPQASPAPGAEIERPNATASPAPTGFRLGVPVALTATALTAFGLLGAAVARGATQSLDEALMRWIDTQATVGLTDRMLTLTDMGSWSVVAVLCLVVTGFLWAHGERRAVLALWLALLGTAFLNDLFKGLYGRERPSVFEWRTEGARGMSYPSGHALNATVAYIFFAYLVTRIRRSPAFLTSVALTAAALIIGVAYSRVYLGVHYPSDVAGGFLIGCAWALACIIALRALEGRGRI